MASPHSYGEHRAQLGELSGDGDRGVAVLVHGGFWRARYGLELMRDLADDLAGRGWTVWNLEYRRLGDGGGHPATLADVAAGIDHLAALDVPRERVAVVGHSAGGQLAAWAATRTDARVPVTDVVAQAGVLDLRMAWELRLSDGVVGRFLGAPDADRFAAASPRERLPIAARLLLTHGERDDTVPVRMSREFHAAAGGELVVDPAAGHDEHLDPAHPLWQAVVAWL